MQHAEGSTPWQKIRLDLFELNGKHYLIAVDYFSSFIEIDLLTSLTSSRVIALLKKQFARFGIPYVIMSDGGPQFVSQEFQDFAKKWGITHMTSSIAYASTSQRQGQISCENHEDFVKKMLSGEN